MAKRRTIKTLQLEAQALIEVSSYRELYNICMKKKSFLCELREPLMIIGGIIASDEWTRNMLYTIVDGVAYTFCEVD